ALIVNGVERRDEIERVALGPFVVVAEVAGLESNVREVADLALRVVDGFTRQIDAEKPTAGKQPCESLQYQTAPATEIDDVDALLEALHESRHERKDVALER